MYLLTMTKEKYSEPCQTSKTDSVLRKQLTAKSCQGMLLPLKS